MKTNRLCPHCSKPYVIQELDVLGTKRELDVPNCKCIDKIEEEETKKQELIKKQDRISKLFSISLLGSKFKKRTFGNWAERKGAEKAFNTCKKLSDNFQKGKSIFLVGNKGNGKTHLASAIVNTLNKKYVPSVFLNMSEFFIQVESTYSKNSKTTLCEMLDTIKLADLVVLNDLGKEKWTSKRIDTLYSMVDMLYNNECSVIVTINPKALKEMENPSQRDLSEKDKETLDAVIDRLKEMCAGNIIRNHADSFREYIAQTIPPHKKVIS